MPVLEMFNPKATESSKSNFVTSSFKTAGLLEDVLGCNSLALAQRK